jgi:hypothetical protein
VTIRLVDYTLRKDKEQKMGKNAVVNVGINNT